jgi:hypothetical protein
VSTYGYLYGYLKPLTGICVRPNESKSAQLRPCAYGYCGYLRVLKISLTHAHTHAHTRTCVRLRDSIPADTRNTRCSALTWEDAYGYSLSAPQRIPARDTRGPPDTRNTAISVCPCPSFREKP